MVLQEVPQGCISKERERERDLTGNDHGMSSLGGLPRCPWWRGGWWKVVPVACDAIIIGITSFLFQACSQT